MYSKDAFFNDGKAISEAVNSRHRNFDDILKVAAAAKRFKEWIADKPDDASLRDEYARTVSKLDWLDALPQKTLRWVIFTLAGNMLGMFHPPIGALSSTILSASDGFLCDKLARGWKPTDQHEPRRGRRHSRLLT